jgi:hypothetical protein
LFGEFVTDAAGTAGDQDRIACEFHLSADSAYKSLGLQRIGYER